MMIMFVPYRYICLKFHSMILKILHPQQQAAHVFFVQMSIHSRSTEPDLAKQLVPIEMILFHPNKKENPPHPQMLLFIFIKSLSLPIISRLSLIFPFYTYFPQFLFIFITIRCLYFCNSNNFIHKTSSCFIKCSFHDFLNCYML